MECFFVCDGDIVYDFVFFMFDIDGLFFVVEGIVCVCVVFDWGEFFVVEIEGFCIGVFVVCLIVVVCIG